MFIQDDAFQIFEFKQQQEAWRLYAVRSLVHLVSLKSPETLIVWGIGLDHFEFSNLQFSALLSDKVKHKVSSCRY